MHRIIRSVVLAIVLGSSALNAAAQGEVTIVDNGVAHYATAQLNAAAHINANAYLYCYLYGNFLSCGAWDGSNSAGCSTTDPAFKRLFPMIKRYSTVRFFVNPDGTCGLVEVSTNSRSLRPPSVPATSKSPPSVYVNAGNRYAYGEIAASAAKPTQSIGCTVQSAFSNIYCTAQDDAGNFVWCAASKDSVNQTLADQMLALKGLNESSQVYFSWDNDPSTPTATCNFIYVFNASYLLP